MVLWLVFAGLTAVAVLAVLVPLSRPAAVADSAAEPDLSIYRDQLAEIDRDLARGIIEAPEAEAARAEVARRVIAADSRHKAAPRPAAASTSRLRAATWSVVVAVPSVALALYLSFGNPHLPGQPLQARMEAPADQQDVDVMIARVERHLADDPEDGRGWEVLAPVYMRIGRYGDAARAWRNVIRLNGATPERQANYGEAVVLASDGLITDEARDAFEAALAESPDAPQPRFYMAMAAEQDGDWQGAVERWQSLLADAPADAPWRGVAEQRLADARDSIGEAAPAGPSAADVAAAAEMSEDDRDAFIASMVAGLAARLAEDGDDLDGWLQLARAHVVLGETDKAHEAITGALRHFEDDAAARQRIDAAARELGLDS